MTTLTVIFLALAIVFLVLFCVSNSTAKALDEDNQRLESTLKHEREMNYSTDRKFLEERQAHLTEKRERECAEADVRRLEKTLKDLRAQMGERAKLCGIKFTANIPLAGWTKTEFKLGVGPCGKEVISVQLVEKPDHYVVTQWCSDGERKEFEYKKEDVAGRIERAYRPHQKTLPTAESIKNSTSVMRPR